MKGLSCNMITPKGQIVCGYKATDKDMKCRGFQFELGKWYEHDGELHMCNSGFHFCEYPSGPWVYYPDGRLFKCEAEEVLVSTSPGADIKHVARRIRLIKEIIITGDRNTGDRNTGDGNTGNRNTGNRNTGNRNAGNWNTGHGNTGDGNTGERNTGERNTGDGNTGHENTGHGNTGDRNTGNRNTGHGNTGDWNAGSRNTGDRNIGSRNTGDRNTGNWNTGNWNTGHGNTGNGHSGVLNWGDAPFTIFNQPADRNEVDFDLVHSLAALLQQDSSIDPEPFLSLPNATVEAIKALHDAHIAARKNKQ